MCEYLNMNDKVRQKYKVFISTKEEKTDMDSSINEFLKGGYEILKKFEDLDNVIVVIRKK